MTRHIHLAVVAAAAALATWWALEPTATPRAQPAAQHAAAPAAAQGSTPGALRLHTAAMVQPAAVAGPQRPAAAAEPLEHASGDEPGVQYVLREDEGVQRRVAYQPEPMAMDNPFGAQAWGERPAATGR